MRKFKLSMLIVMMMAAALNGCKRNITLDNVDVSVEEARRLIERNANDPDFIVIDIRTPAEYAEGHIENAINIDYYAPDFYNKLADLDKDNTYLVYCRSGARSAKAMEIFDSLGFKNVYHMKNGYNAWK